MMDRYTALSKVPAVTLGFWAIKILATTLGETGGDALSMSWLGETTAAAGSSGLNGYLVEPCDIDTLATRVATLIADPSLCARMGQAGRTLVEQQFTVQPVREFEKLLLRYVRPDPSA